MSKIRFYKQYGETALVACTCVSTFLLFTPLYVYWTNAGEWSFSIRDVLGLLIGVTVTTSLLTTILLSRLKGSAFGTVKLVLVGATFLSWLEGNILLKSYGVVDGRQIQWHEFGAQSCIDALIWAVFLIVLYLARKHFLRVAKEISIGLLLAQAVLIISAYVNAPAEPGWNGSVGEATKFQFSTTKNVIVLVLDAFQTDIFQELLNENPNYLGIFQGFTYFRNAVGGFPTTYPSIPLILTGQYYDNSLPITDFLESVYTSECLPRILKREGYRIESYSFSGQPIRHYEDYMSPERMGTSLGAKIGALGDLWSAAAYRNAPGLLKASLHENLSQRLLMPVTRSNLSFAQEASNVAVTCDKPVFKFFHLGGAHPPFYLNEELEIKDLGYTREAYKTQSRAMLEIIRRFLVALDAAGAYDNSLIFVVGDHGGSGFGVNLAASGYPGPHGRTGIISSSTISPGLPLVLAKPFSRRGALKVSDAPVCLSDIPKTVTSVLGLESELPGRSMFEVAETDVRKRRFLWYGWEHSYWLRNYLPEMQEYEIDGFSWLTRSWTPTHRRFTRSGIEVLEPPVYQYGSEIRFGEGGNAEHYQGVGWSLPEEGFTWTEAETASLLMPVGPSRSDLVLKATLFPFVAGGLDKQKVEIYVGEERLGEWLVRDSGEYQMVIPKECVRDPLRIDFALPGCVSPKELGVSSDLRTLGIAMRSVTVLQVPEYEYGSEIRFGEGGNAEHYQGMGWSLPEEGFTWTDGESASLLIPIDPSQSDVVLKATLSPFIKGDIDKQRVEIYVGEDRLGEWVVAKPGEYEIVIPEALVRDSQLAIHFELPDSISPAVLGISSDGRDLGIAFQSLTITAGR
ncbi:MAG: sulfatase-like hydrolase/transferase [Firmicutes bacterium]|nr:sulfatase-like hydrolase/transferase [Bacillota bacterium]